MHKMNSLISCPLTMNKIRNLIDYFLLNTLENILERLQKLLLIFELIRFPFLQEPFSQLFQ